VLIALAQESKAKGWWQAYGDVVPDWFELYVGMEQAASRLRTYAPSLIPGLLQCREYAEFVFEKWLGKDATGVHNAVAVRLGRQSLLTRRLPEAPQVEIMVDEGVLRRRIPDRLGMRKQLAHLVNVSTRPNVRVRVIPFAAGPHRAAGSGQFTILDFPAVDAASPEPTTVYCENLTGALYLDKTADVDAYRSIWGELVDTALDQGESDALIQEIIKENDE
jgi:hypothetical protein